MNKILKSIVISLPLLFISNVYSAELKPKVIVSEQLSGTSSQLEIKAAMTYAKFWNTGKESYAREALAKDFIDMTPPEGRIPGVEGVLKASKDFRSVVPNLSVDVEHLLVTGDYVTVRYRFKGNFTGTMGNIKGSGQQINFNAVDVYQIKNGQIYKNWHLEDYATFNQQVESAI
ncbi:Putative uncharacterized protein [Moritella viscosa]|uniref:Uncharacterized protein n=1 Tax=Moritella viscosa TaxID=80854 RepID=A0A090IIV4_9GAMM|nr:ester cyclase [Moritella viscosa]CED60049.1 putative SnoaL-like polyketide cyclase [Moritella viscosa]SGZ14339.1 Putative uncharacterized protein [Moritella viscosa]SHO13926.1 Putative uncharacterized protein [Moritella viscosa]SHO13929.1 Putative uncharacterized protein [Moritella viscosa]SHO15124.1 Putative uncharacterized protein [Moritella viscosa]